MLKLENINKYFYKNKSNQIHVINDTSIEFGDKGLIALLGNSGSGKTTMLNVIGGLDKWQSGSLIIDGVKYTRKNYHKLNKIRNLNIGYIFQDYKIIDDMSVYDNVAISLKMIGIKDKKYLKERVDYVLNTLELYRYRNRLASTLSGGERQRVGIARAIAKNPDIVLCDEPTGNLDSKNSIEIMNIIKAISKERLVILVTHETELANFYADRIIEVSDGKVISEKKNDNVSELDYQMDNKIYLKDFDNHLKFKDKGVEINYYFNGEDANKIDIVLRNGNLYIDTKCNVEVVSDDGKYEFVNDHYKKIDKSVYEKYQFKMEDYNKKDSSIFSLFTCIKNAFFKSHNYKGVKKAVLFCHFITGFFILFTLACLLGVTQIKKENYARVDDSYVSLFLKNVNYEEVITEINKYQYNYYFNGLPESSLSFDTSNFYQTSEIDSMVSVSISFLSLINDEDIVAGRMPQNDNEIVIDKLVYDNSVKYQTDSSLISLGIREAKEVIGRKVEIDNGVEYTVVGIVDRSTPCVYIKPEMFNGVKSAAFIDNNALNDIYAYLDKITLVEGNMPNDNEAIMWKGHQNILPIGSTLEYNKNTITIVGYYDINDSSLITSNYFNNNPLLINANTFDKLREVGFLVISTNNKKELIDGLKAYNSSLVPQDMQEDIREDYYFERMYTAKSTITMCAVLLVVTLLEIYFLNRSAFLSRIREVGIYRAIGVHKGDIYRMFASETLYTTVVYGFGGIIISYFLLDALVTYREFSEIFFINIPIAIGCMLVVLIFNLIVCLLPVMNVLRKTPAEILSRKDI